MVQYKGLIGIMTESCSVEETAPVLYLLFSKTPTKASRVLPDLLNDTIDDAPTGALNLSEALGHVVGGAVAIHVSTCAGDVAGMVAMNRDPTSVVGCYRSLHQKVNDSSMSARYSS